MVNLLVIFGTKGTNMGTPHRLRRADPREEIPEDMVPSASAEAEVLCDGGPVGLPWNKGQPQGASLA